MSAGVRTAAGQPTSAPGARTAYASAAALQEQGLYDLAADAWRDLLRKSPEAQLASRARYNLGVCRFHAGSFAEAAEQFASVADRERFPDLAEAAWANLGLARLNAARTRMADPDHDPERLAAELAKAVEAFDRGIAEFENGNQAAANLFHRGETLMLLARPSEAAEAFRRVLGRQAGLPLERQARVALGNALLDAGQSEQVAEAVNPVVEDKGAPLLAAEARLLRAEAALVGDQPIKAAQDFQLASQVEGFVDAAYAAERAAFSWYSASKAAKAAEAYSSLADRFPDAPVAAGARLSAGKCWLLAEQPEKGAAVLATSWRSNPTQENAEAARWWSRALLDADQPAEALAAARDALATKPRDAAPLRLLTADALAAINGQRPAAADEYEAFAKTWPDDPSAPRALTQAAGIALEASDAKRARQLAGRVLELKTPAELATNARSIFADAALSLEDWQAAVSAYEKLIAAADSDPRLPRWRRGLADGLAGAGKQEEVVAALGRLIDAHPTDPRTRRARYDRGRMLTSGGNLNAANTDFHAVIQAIPDDSLAAYTRLALATNQRTAGDYRSCVATLGTLLAASPTEVDGQAKFLLASAQHALRDFEAALKSLDGAEAAPSERLRLRALCLIGLKRFADAAEAVEVCRKEGLAALQMAELRHELGWMHRDAGRNDAALAAFSQAALLAPGGALAAESLFRVGEIHSEAKRYKQASQAFADAAKSGNVDLREQALHLLGWARWNSAQRAEAAEAFRRQLEAAPSGGLAGDGRLMLGECLFAQKKYAAALASYREAYKSKSQASNPELLPLALLHAGQAAGQVGDWKASLELLDRVKKIATGTTLTDQTAYERAWALHKLGRNAEAAPEFARLAEQATGVLAARAAFVRGELHFAAKEHDLAVRMFYRVAYGFGGRDAPPEYHTWQAESLFEAARCLERLGRVDPARKLYAELLERFPDSPKARLARDRLPSEK